MPVRKSTLVKNPKKNQEVEYTYEGLLAKLREKIDGEFGGVTAFLKSKEYKKLKFEDSATMRGRMMSVLSKPADGERKKVRSFPILQKLYSGMFGIELKSKVKVIREQIFYTDDKINISTP